MWKEPLNADNNEVPVDGFDMNSLFYEPGQRSYMRDHVASMVRGSLCTRLCISQGDSQHAAHGALTLYRGGLCCFSMMGDCTAECSSSLSPALHSRQCSPCQKLSLILQQVHTLVHRSHSCSVLQVLQQAGAPYPYTEYMHLKLNGQFYGLYLFTEDNNNQYLDVRAHITSAASNFCLGCSPQNLLHAC